MSNLAPISDAIIIVDVLSFSTCVDIATGGGALVFPYRWDDETAFEFACSVGAEVAARERSEGRYSLSPASLMSISEGERLVLPSPNGSTLALSTGGTPTLAGCLRNAAAVAKGAMRHGQKIAIIPAGERWGNGSLRPAFEDLAGAGAIINCLEGSKSPEAQAALSVFISSALRLRDLIRECVSGRELISRGFEEDLLLAAEFNLSDSVPVLIDGKFVNKN